MFSRVLLACLDLLTLGTVGCGDDAAASDASVSDAVVSDATGYDAAPDAVVDDGGTADAATTDGATDAGADNMFAMLEAEALLTDFLFSEGPVWRSGEGDLLVCDIPLRSIVRWSEGEGRSILRAEVDCNGLIMEGSDVLIAGFLGRGLSRLSGETLTTRMLSFDEDEFNSPNDLVLAENGIYITDPGYLAEVRIIDFNGVFFLTDDAITLVDRFTEVERPNGIGLSPAGDVLYVAETTSENLYAYDILDDGTYGPRRTFATVATGGDGMALDVMGNIYLATSLGVQVVSPAGELLGTIPVPVTPANCTFGGDDLRTLFITARHTLFRIDDMPFAGLTPRGI